MVELGIMLVATILAGLGTKKEDEKKPSETTLAKETDVNRRTRSSKSKKYRNRWLD